jgi:hypothetical protein
VYIVIIMVGIDYAWQTIEHWPRQTDTALPGERTQKLPRDEPKCVGLRARGKGVSVDCSRAVGTVLSLKLVRDMTDSEKCLVSIRIARANSCHALIKVDT